MAPSQPITTRDSRILIIGAGVFGLSTALELARQGYNNVKVIDREVIPSLYSAANDLNKIVRAEYEDPFYTELALDAMRQWECPFWAPFYRPTGYLVCTSAASTQKARDALMKSLSSIEHHPSYPTGSFKAISSAGDIYSLAPKVEGPLKGWTGYFNKHAGYARAAEALTHAYSTCLSLGVVFETGDDGYAVRLEYSASSTTDESRCTGVQTASGKIHTADTTILALGAHIARLLPTIAPQITAKAWAVGHLQLTPSEVTSLAGIPVVNCRDLGFFFEPDFKTGLLKLAAHGAGYTNYSPNGVSVPPLESSSNDGIPIEDEQLIRRLIVETIPQFADRELVKKFICWCADTTDSEFIIDYVPGDKGLIVASGDSGHLFKMLPIAGKWVRHVIEAREQRSGRWKWKGIVKGDKEDISWRVGTLKDLRDVRRKTGVANL